MIRFNGKCLSIRLHRCHICHRSDSRIIGKNIFQCFFTYVRCQFFSVGHRYSVTDCNGPYQIFGLLNGSCQKRKHFLRIIIQNKKRFCCTHRKRFVSCIIYCRVCSKSGLRIWRSNRIRKCNALCNSSQRTACQYTCRNYNSCCHFSCFSCSHYFSSIYLHSFSEAVFFFGFSTSFRLSPNILIIITTHKMASPGNSTVQGAVCKDAFASFNIFPHSG